MGLDILRGVSCPDHRATLIELNQQGWEIEKTGGGHLKLTHMQAKKPVFSASTTSDFRSRLNLVAQCKNAILISQSQQADGESELSERQFRKALQDQKKLKKNKKRRVIFDRRETAKNETITSEAMQRMLGSGAAKKASSTAIPLVAMPPVKPQQPLRASEKPAKTKRKPVMRAARVKPEEKRHTDASGAVQPPASETPEENAKNAKKVESNMNVSTLPKPAAPKAIATKAAAGKQAPSAMISNTPPTPRSPELTSIPSEVLALAQKIASGAYQQFEVTEDMLGQTILYSGDIMIAKPQASAAPSISPSPATAVGVSGVCETTAAVGTRHPGLSVEGRAASRNVNDKLMDAIKQFSPEAVTQKDLSDLLYEELGYKSASSALASFSARLSKLVEAGLVSEEKKGRLRAFRVKA